MNQLAFFCSSKRQRVTTRDARRLGLRFRHGLHALLSVQPSACLMVRGWVSCVVWFWFAVPLACRLCSDVLSLGYFLPSCWMQSFLGPSVLLVCKCLTFLVRLLSSLPFFLLSFLWHSVSAHRGTDGLTLQRATCKLILDFFDFLEASLAFHFTSRLLCAKLLSLNRL